MRDQSKGRGLLKRREENVEKFTVEEGRVIRVKGREFKGLSGAVGSLS